MKLVDILARKLKFWPKEAEIITQDRDGMLNEYSVGYKPHTSSGNVWGGGARYVVGFADEDGDVRLPVADDQGHATITRAQWQAAVDALAAKSSEAAKDMHDTAVNAQDRDGINIHSDESHPTMDHIVEFELLQGMASGNQYRCNVKGIDPGYQEPFKTEWNGEGLPPVGTEFESKSGKGWCECIAVAHDGGFVVFRRYFKGSEYGLYGHCYAGSDQMRPIRSAEQIAAEERKLGIEEMSAHGIDAGDSTIEYTCAALWDAGYRKQ